MRTPDRTTTAVAGVVAVALGVAVVVVASIAAPGSSRDDFASPLAITARLPQPPDLTTTTVAPTTTTTADDGSMKMGRTGPDVAALQGRLSALGFWLGTPSGTYDILTFEAVLAFQKVEGLQRDGFAGPASLAAVATAKRPTPRLAADGIEIDLARQTLMVIQGGQVKWTINTSTGKPSTPTDPGDFVVQRQIDGVDHAPLGDLYRPKYFNAGDAIHGSPYIPGYAASHGCARVSNAAMDLLWASGNLAIGTPVRVH